MIYTDIYTTYVTSCNIYCKRKGDLAEHLSLSYHKEYCLEPAWYTFLFHAFFKSPTKPLWNISEPPRILEKNGYIIGCHPCRATYESNLLRKCQGTFGKQLWLIIVPHFSKPLVFPAVLQGCEFTQKSRSKRESSSKPMPHDKGLFNWLYKSLLQKKKLKHIITRYCG